MRGLDLRLETINNPDRVLVILGQPSVGPIGTTTPTGSPITHTNNDSYDEVVYLVGGTITDVTRNGQSLGTEQVHPLAPGDSIVITYTAAPTIRRFGV